jgi:hypothetical protein
MPSTFSLVTSCARAGDPASQTPEINAATIKIFDFMKSLLPQKWAYTINPSFSQNRTEAQVFSSTAWGLWPPDFGPR